MTDAGVPLWGRRRRSLGGKIHVKINVRQHMLEAQKQQHLRSLRRGINRAVTAIKEGEQVVCHTGWAYGSCFTHPWLESHGTGLDFPPLEDLFLLLPPFDREELAKWGGLLPEEVFSALEAFWPGPLHLRVKLAIGPDGRVARLLVASPWHPLMQELLARSGPLLWRPLPPSEAEALERAGPSSEDAPEKSRALVWPEKESPLPSTLLDVSTRPWRLLAQGFVGVEELRKRLKVPFLLSQERAFPLRPIRTYVPEGKTYIVEAEDLELLLPALQSLRLQVPADAFVRLYLDETTAHNHFPDDREVRVYGDLGDLERVRRRLQAMLERQNRRLGKRVQFIAVSGLGPGSESFRADLVKLSDGWLRVEQGVDLQLDVR